MREATGNALLIGIVSSIIGLIMIFFVGSISYSKAYRVKNYIVNIIEEDRGWNNTNIDDYLKDVGYPIRKGENRCPGSDNKCTLLSDNNSGYDYCVYECRETETKNYFKVITFMKFDFPVVRNIIRFNVTGETKTFSNFN